MNKQVKILENKAKMIEANLIELGKQIDARRNFLCREDPLYQKILEEGRMEKVRLNDMSEFIQMMEQKTDEPRKPKVIGQPKEAKSPEPTPTKPGRRKRAGTNEKDPDGGDKGAKVSP